MAHTHYKGTGKVHSFRGLLEDGGQDEISIQGSVGAIAWRITKLQVINQNPTTENVESVVQVWLLEQDVTSLNLLIDISNNELLGVVHYAGDEDGNNYPVTQTIIFDNTIFNKNIYVTQKGQGANVDNMNYYIELEEVTLSATGMAQLALAAARRAG